MDAFPKVLPLPQPTPAPQVHRPHQNDYYPTQWRVVSPASFYSVTYENKENKPQTDILEHRRTYFFGRNHNELLDFLACHPKLDLWHPKSRFHLEKRISGVWKRIFSPNG